MNKEAVEWLEERLGTPGYRTLFKVSPYVHGFFTLEDDPIGIRNPTAASWPNPNSEHDLERWY